MYSRQRNDIVEYKSVGYASLLNSNPIVTVSGTSEKEITKLCNFTIRILNILPFPQLRFTSAIATAIFAATRKVAATKWVSVSVKIAHSE